MDPWPPRCCVAAFIVEALHEFGVTVSAEERPLIARALKTRVGSTDENPWGLETTGDPNFRGVSPLNAIELVPPLLMRYHNALLFRHIPFETVALEQYVEVFAAAIGQGCVVGVGFDYSIITGSSDPAPHVARIIPSSMLDGVCMLDAESSRPVFHLIQWEKLIMSTRSLGDGYWVIGQSNTLNLPYTLPYSSP
jgi:hypothetical protein